MSDIGIDFETDLRMMLSAYTKNRHIDGFRIIHDAGGRVATVQTFKGPVLTNSFDAAPYQDRRQEDVPGLNAAAMVRDMLVDLLGPVL